MLRWAATQYSLKDKALDIFFAGCSKPHCPGCHNPELHSFDCAPRGIGILLAKIAAGGTMIDRVRLMGGEPLDQDLFPLFFLIKMISSTKDVWLFTKYMPDELTKNQQEICNSVRYVKHGRYMEDLPGTTCPLTGTDLASSNQFILDYPRPTHDLNYPPKYNITDKRK